MLAQLLEKDVALIGNLRKTDEEKLSVIVIVSAITGLNAVESARALRRIYDERPEVRARCTHHKFPGRGQRNTPVADLATIVEIIFLLPGRTAARVRYEAAKLVVRYLGGDLGLVDEVQQLAHVQASLREQDPDHPLRVFGEAVEAEDGVVLAREDATTTIQTQSSATATRTHLSERARTSSLQESCIDWSTDLDVSRQELQGVKLQFKTLLQMEIASGQLPQRTPVEAWSKAPPHRLKELAQAAVTSYRALLERRYHTIEVADATGEKKRKRSSEESEDSEGEDGIDVDDDVLKISHVMQEAGVWKGVWSSFRSDLSNQMLVLKCADTNADFSARRLEVVRGNQVHVHAYKKSEDWPLAWKALQNSRDLYEKRIREFLEEMYTIAGHPVDAHIHLAKKLAKDIAATLKVSA